MPVKWIPPGLPLYDALIAELCGGERQSGLPDFSNTLVILPGRQFLRNVKKNLAERFPHGVCPPAMLTPGGALHFGRQNAGTASDGEQLFLWERVLRTHAHDREVSFLMPERAQLWSDDDFSHMANLFFELRQELLRSGKTIGEAAGLLAENDARWNALAQLEKWFREEMQRLQLADPAEQDRAAAAECGELEARFSRILIAFVPDLPQLLQKKLELLKIPVTILVRSEKAPQDFDPWGRPAAAWSTRELPVAPRQLHAVPDVEEAAKLTLRLATENGRRPFSPAESAIVLGRPAFFPGFAQIFAQLNTGDRQPVRLFSPEGIRGRDLRISRLLHTLYRAMLHPDDFELFSQLLRNRELLSCLLHGKDLSVHFFLSLFDEFTTECLPDRVSAAGKLLAGRFAPLAPVFAEGTALLESFLHTKDFCTALKLFLKRVFNRPNYAPVHGIVFADEELFWRNALYELRNSPVLALLRTPEKQLQYLLDECGRHLFYPVRPENSIPVFNFLELPALEQKQLFLIGLNNGIFPANPGVTPFLTDTIRKKIGLPCADMLAALENFKLISLMKEQRELHLIVLAADEEHTPLRPSELLFHGCSETELLRRAAICRNPEKLPLTAPEDEKPGIFQLNFHKIAQQKFFQETPFRLSVTNFKTYLESPRLFLLQKAYGIDCPDYANRELPPNDFGSACHCGFEMLPGKDCVTEADFARVLCAGADQYLMEKCGLPLPLLIRLQQKQIHSRLEAAAQLLAAEATRFRLLEAEYSLNSGEGILFGNALIKGKIDRIELSADRKLLRLLDIKTYSNAKTPEQDHVSKNQLFNLQLPLYDRLLRLDRAFWEKHELEPERVTIQAGYLLLTANPRQTQISVWGDSFPGFCEQTEEIVCRIVRELEALRDCGELPQEKPRGDFYQLQSLLLPDAGSAVTMEETR